jgi:hypothetical protein
MVIMSTRKRTLLAFVIVAGLAYPLYTGMLFFIDTFSGDRIILRQLHRSRRALFDVFIAGYLHAIPVFYLGGLLTLFVPSILLWHFGIQRRFPILVINGLLGGGIGGYLAGGLLHWTAFQHALFGLLISGIFVLMAGE